MNIGPLRPLSSIRLLVFFIQRNRIEALISVSTLSLSSIIDTSRLFMAPRLCYCMEVLVLDSYLYFTIGHKIKSRHTIVCRAAQEAGMPHSSTMSTHKGVEGGEWQGIDFKMEEDLDWSPDSTHENRELYWLLSS